MRSEDNLAASRFQTAFDLYAAGEEMMRLKLVRDNPDLAADKVEELLMEWLKHRPGAERGDGPGPSRAAG